MRELASSVRVRIAAAATVVTAVALVVGGWALLRAVEDTQTAELRRRAEERLDQIAERIEQGRPLADSARLAGPPLGVVRILDTETGDVLVALDAFPGEEPVVFRSTVPGVGQQIEEGVDAAGPMTIRLEAISRTVETPRGPVTIVAGAPADEISRSVAAVRRVLYLALPLLLAVVAAVSWVVVGRALRPVEEMRAEVEEISASTLHRRVPDPGSHDEVARLASTMNAMLDRIEAATTRQRQFVSDASHELRSPVAALRTELEVALRAGDATSLRSAVTAALEEEERLERLLDHLLVLASIDEGAPLAHTEHVDVGELAEGEAARRREVPVRVRRPVPAAAVTGSAHDLVRVLANLVDNAAAHAASAVEVGVAVADGRVVVTVDDDGPGVPAGERERVFERFTRLDEGRSRASGGAGLGLALVRAIVQRHGGTVVIEESPLGGARARVDLPAA